MIMVYLVIAIQVLLYFRYIPLEFFLVFFAVL